MHKVNNDELCTKFSRVILASQSETRIEMMKEHFTEVICVSHKAEEESYKCQKKKPEQIVLEIAKEKVLSVVKDFPQEMVIAADQILVCGEKIISKPKNLEAAKKKLIFLKNKTHKLYSSIYVMLKKKFYFKQVKKASVYFSNISQKVIEDYVESNKKTVLTTVGSYKIEENSKHKFISKINGDLETVLGFPINDLIEKIKHEK